MHSLSIAMNFVRRSGCLNSGVMRGRRKCSRPTGKRGTKFARLENARLEI